MLLGEADSSCLASLARRNDKDLAAAFHSYYNSTHFLVDGQRLKLARLALIRAVRHALANGLKLLGVSTPAKM